jgi:ATP-binding protein involved in chromosome partitioning
MIVAKSVRMATTTGTPVLGLVENMGAMICPHCGQEFSLFSQGTSAVAGTELGLPRLARFAWRKELSQSGSLVWASLPEDLKQAATAFSSEVIMALKTQAK